MTTANGNGRLAVWDQYAADVMSGRQVAGKWIRLAAERHARDMKTGQARGLSFDYQAAMRAILFFSILKHYKGEWAGQAISLEPWQQFIIASLFGWMRADGSRRFRTAYLEIARKNGKTLIAAGIGLYLLLADGEPGAEIYTCATKLDQARIAHTDAKEMTKRAPALARELRVIKNNISHEASASKYEPLGRDSQRLDGLNVHGAIMDEIHAWPGRELFDVIETATSARRQPLIVLITTAGQSRASFCYEQHEYTAGVLAGTIEDDSFFGMVYALDPEDDHNDPAVWIKANPNLDISKKSEVMHERAEKARQNASARAAFRRLDCNIWTMAARHWIPADVWAKNGRENRAAEADLMGRICYAGLDLSRTIDITAAVLLFPPVVDDPKYRVLCRFWIPEETMIDKIKTDRVPYDAWAEAGYITPTPGAVIDYDWILDQLNEDAENYELREIGFDKWGAANVITQMQNAGHTVIEMRQGYATLSAPTKELERLIYAGGLEHYKNPVLSWMIANAIAREDPAGNIKPDKAQARDRIDGVVALIMALDRAMRHKQKRSKYEDRDLASI